MNSINLITILGVILGVGILWNLFNRIIFPWLIEIRTKDIEVNPNWITSKTKEFYGFSDMDFVIVDSPLGITPRFRMSKKEKRLQLLIDNETKTSDLEKLMFIALVGKLKIIHGVWFPNKPLYWLSILCYMLDGNNINLEATSWEEVDKKTVDLPK